MLSSSSLESLQGYITYINSKLIFIRCPVLRDDHCAVLAVCFFSCAILGRLHFDQQVIFVGLDTPKFRVEKAKI